MVEVTPNLDSTVRHIETDSGKPTKDFYNWLRDITRVIRGFGDIVTHDASEFVPAAAPASDFVKIATVTANNTSPQLAITAGIDATYRAYKFLLNNVLPATDNQTLVLQVSVNAGASWLGGGYLSSAWTVASNTGNAIVTATTSINIMATGGSNVAANGGLCGEITLFSPSAAIGNKFIQVDTSHANQPASALIKVTGMGAWIGNTPINAIRLISSTGAGNIASGSLTMYGMK